MDHKTDIFVRFSDHHKSLALENLTRLDHLNTRLVTVNVSCIKRFLKYDWYFVAQNFGGWRGQDQTAILIQALRACFVWETGESSDIHK